MIFLIYLIFIEQLLLTSYLCSILYVTLSNQCYDKTAKKRQYTDFCY